MNGPVFIVGMPRSGTTLLSMILNSHSKLAISPETHYFTKYWNSWRRTRALHNEASRRRFLQFLFASPEFKDLHFTDDEARSLFVRLAANPTLDHRSVLEALLGSYAQRQGKRIWGEKTPDHLRYVPDIAEMFPEARFICITRDPRDVSLSWKEVPWNRGNVIFHASRWKQYVRLAQKFSARYSDRFLNIRYEDLVDDPYRTVKSICTFLNLQFEPGMLEYHKGENRTFDVHREPWKAASTQPITGTNARKWMVRMSAEQIQLVEMLVGTELRVLGYPTVGKGWNAAFMASALGLFIQNTVSVNVARAKHLLTRLRPLVK